MHIGLYYCVHVAAVAFSPNPERGLVRAFRKRSCGGRASVKREGGDTGGRARETNT